MAKSADTTHGAKGRPITKASGASNITPVINTNPSLTDKASRDITGAGGGEPVKNGPLLTDPTG